MLYDHFRKFKFGTDFIEEHFYYYLYLVLKKIFLRKRAKNLFLRIRYKICSIHDLEVMKQKKHKQKKMYFAIVNNFLKLRPFMIFI